MHMNRFVVSQLEDEWLATDGDRKLIAQNCRDLANAHPAGGAARTASRDR